MFFKINDSKQIKKADNAQIKYNSEKQSMQNAAKQNYHDSVAFYNTWPGNEVELV